jgi:hypothetical protein
VRGLWGSVFTMTSWLVALLMLGANPESPLEQAHSAFIERHLAVGASPSPLIKEFRSLEAQWQKLTRATSPVVVTALVRQGELRWHLADELERAGPPSEVQVLGEKGVATYRDQMAVNIATLRKEAWEKWAQADALAGQNGLKPPAPP